MIDLEQDPSELLTPVPEPGAEFLEVVYPAGSGQCRWAGHPPQWPRLLPRPQGEAPRPDRVRGICVGLRGLFGLRRHYPAPALELRRRRGKSGLVCTGPMAATCPRRRRLGQRADSGPPARPLTPGGPVRWPRRSARDGLSSSDALGQLKESAQLSVPVPGHNHGCTLPLYLSMQLH